MEKVDARSRFFRDGYVPEADSRAMKVRDDLRPKQGIRQVLENGKLNLKVVFQF